MKYREQPCIHYICKGKCFFGRKTDHKGRCQHCRTYKPRSKEVIPNKKKTDKRRYVE